MWRDLDLLQYCTVHIAIRTFALMRDDFAPQVMEKLRIAVANIAIDRITVNKGFNSQQPQETLFAERRNSKCTL